MTASRLLSPVAAHRARTSNWLLTNVTASNTATVTAAAYELDDSVAYITGHPTTIKHFYQQIHTSGKAGDTYVLSGWAKGDSAPIPGYDANKRDFSLVCIFHNTDGSVTERTVQFNPDTDSTVAWQYAAGAVVADKDFHTLYVDIRYDYNVNTVYFDGIQLYKEGFGSSYTYDDKGNVVSVVDLQKQTTSYEYDTSSNVTRILENNQAKVAYTYDDYHNVKTATTPEGLLYSFGYDTYGNNTALSILGSKYSMYSSAAYSSDGNRMISSTDAAGKVTQYSYNEDTNVLEWVQYPEDTEATRTNYSYDGMYRLASAAVTTDTGTALSASYTYSDDLLTAIQTPSTTYSFAYGDFAQRSSVKIGSRTLASYTYTNDRNKYLSALDYGNGDRIQYTYDIQGRLISETYEDGDTVTYAYDNNGSLATVTDSASGITTTYYYDLTDRLMRYTETGNGYSHSVSYEYDDRNNLASMVEDINGAKVSISYEYDEDNRVSSVYDGMTSRHYHYNDAGMLSGYTTYVDTTRIDESIGYRATAYYEYSRDISSQISGHGISSNGYQNSYEYYYDDNGNIEAVYEIEYTTYSYDSANQLIAENYPSGTKFTYTYDDAGNLLSRIRYENYSTQVEAPTYTYDDREWGDLLTGYNGKEITTDAIGNMLSDGTWTYSWEHGRQLAAMSDGSGPIEISAHPEDYRGAIGDTATFTVAAEGDGLSYQWQYSSNSGTSWRSLSRESANTPTLSIELTEARIGFLYRCSIQDVNGNKIYSNSGELCLSAVQQVAILEHPQDFVGNIGDKASFTVSARGENLTYRWQFCKTGTAWRDSTMNGSDTPTVSIQLTAARVGNRYRCVVTDAAGNSRTSTAAALSQTPGAISISSHPEDYRGDIGDTAAFTVAAEGEGLSYQWQYSSNSGTSWRSLSRESANTPTLSIELTEARIGFLYRCSIQDVNGNKIYSNSGELCLSAVQQVAILEHPQDFVGNIGDMITFTVSARGENLTYQWQYSASQSSWRDSTLNGCTTPTLRLEFKDYRAGTRYRCVVTDAAGNSRTSMAATILEDAAAWRFTYNADGMRTKRTNGTDTYSYVYNGSQLSQMTVGSNTLRFFYDANGNPITVTYNGNLYYYVNNVQGDVVAILDSSGLPVVRYVYNAWGVLLETIHYEDDPIAQYNPLRYRGYVYDTETGLYYVSSRYYDPELGRFISPDTTDILTATPMALTDKNLYAYCDNNPVVRVDHGGQFWETVFDVISLGASIVEVCINPTDPWAWAGLAGDAIDLIPFVTGVGEVTRAVKTIDKVADVVDTTHDIAKAANRVENVIDTSASGIRYTDKVLKQMNNTADLNHAFPSVIDTFVDIYSGRPLKGGDGIMRNLIELPGSINNTPGIFEYIIEPNGMCNHRYFRKLR